jgi:SAM-dependent methyltransferase
MQSGKPDSYLVLSILVYESSSTPASCRACFGEILEEVLPTWTSPFGDLLCSNMGDARDSKTSPIRLVICAKCQLLQLICSWDYRALYKNYVYRTSTTKQLVSILKELALTSIQKHDLKAGDLVVEIGSGDGTLLAEFYNRGLRVLGIDPNATNLTLERSLHPFLIDEFFEDLSEAYISSIKSLRPKVVFSSFTIANVEYLHRFMLNLQNLGSLDTQFVFLTGYHPNQFHNLMFDYISHDHLSYFDKASFTNLLMLYGFKLDRYELIDFRNGSAIFWFSREKNFIDSRNFLNPVFEQTEFSVLQIQDLFSSFRKQLRDLSKFIHSLPSCDAILGFGGATSTTYLLSLMDSLAVSRIQAIYDDDGAKHGKFIPRFSIPLLGTDKFPTKKCIIIILSWQHQAVIRARLAKLGFRGTIIVPLPELDIQEET